MQIRAAGPGDADVLWRMLVEAFDWAGGSGSLAQVQSRPDVAHYVQGWPVEGDFGVVAADDAGSAVGAAWARLLTAADPGYGWVGDDVPELSMGVLPEHRAAGVGTALLSALIESARSRGIARLSLSVEDGNPARRLYERAGFRKVGRNGGSDTLALSLQ